MGIPSASKLYFLKVDVFHAPLLETDEMGEVSLESKYTHDASISALKSVSGFTVDVLKFVPFSTVNH